jgi:hypothetical protein
MLYSYKGEYPTQLPDRIRLSNGTTRTNKLTFTEQEIEDAGYIKVSDYPNDFDNKVYKVIWDYDHADWVVSVKSEEEIAQDIERKWQEIRFIRDEKIKEVEWQINRYNSHVRLELTLIDDINKLDTYIQALRDITTQEDPYNIVWPTLE